mmetsp:Transcript_12997/g.29574  ORF Transcript_12997/g.29574 Transcript_12997/m.29574 type:complete len:219 (-) Transcript_12997:368-1024(-)
MVVVPHLEALAHDQQFADRIGHQVREDHLVDVQDEAESHGVHDDVCHARGLHEECYTGLGRDQPDKALWDKDGDKIEDLPEGRDACHMDADLADPVLVVGHPVRIVLVLYPGLRLGRRPREEGHHGANLVELVHHGQHVDETAHPAADVALHPVLAGVHGLVDLGRLLREDSLHGVSREDARDPLLPAVQPGSADLAAGGARAAGVAGAVLQVRAKVA